MADTNSKGVLGNSRVKQLGRRQDLWAWSDIGYRLFASSSRPLSEPSSIGVDNDGEDDNATGDHLPHKISNTHQD